MSNRLGAPPSGLPKEPAAVEVGDHWELEFGSWKVQVDAQRGARICSFSLDGANVLVGPEVDPNNFGSTFWTSPQSAWGWPPVPEIDHRPYAVVESDSGLVCCGSLASQLGVLVTKRFNVVVGRNCLRVQYEVCNQTSETLRLAPWEVSRVRGGLTFFSLGDGHWKGEQVACPEVLDAAGATWFEYDRGAITCDQKLFAHANEGWLAHVEQGLAFIKQFDPVPADKQAPGEAMIEVFASGERPYVELEQQGAYAKLGPWKSSTWTVHWLLRRLPPGLTVRAGNVELVDWVREQLG